MPIWGYPLFSGKSMVQRDASALAMPDKHIHHRHEPRSVVCAPLKPPKMLCLAPMDATPTCAVSVPHSTIAPCSVMPDTLHTQTLAASACHCRRSHRNSVLQRTDFPEIAHDSVFDPHRSTLTRPSSVPAGTARRQTTLCVRLLGSDSCACAFAPAGTSYYGAHMSAKTFSRDFAQGQTKKLRRMRQPLVMQLPPPSPRNHVARAMVLRASSGGAGKHIRSQGAQRRADKMEVQKQTGNRRSFKDWN